MMARLCPAGMIFVPSVGGLSHNVREETKPEHLEAGATVLIARRDAAGGVSGRSQFAGNTTVKELPRSGS